MATWRDGAEYAPKTSPDAFIPPREERSTGDDDLATPGQFGGTTLTADSPQASTSTSAPNAHAGADFPTTRPTGYDTPAGAPQLDAVGDPASQIQRDPQQPFFTDGAMAQPARHSWQAATEPLGTGTREGSSPVFAAAPGLWPSEFPAPQAIAVQVDSEPSARVKLPVLALIILGLGALSFIQIRGYVATPWAWITIPLSFLTRTPLTHRISEFLVRVLYTTVVAVAIAGIGAVFGLAQDRWMLAYSYGFLTWLPWACFLLGLGLAGIHVLDAKLPPQSAPR